MKTRAINKAQAQAQFLEIEIAKLKISKPQGATTQEMIDQQIAYKYRELNMWKHIKFALK